MYDDIFNYVKSLLAQNDSEASKIGHLSFRKRSEHIWRVFIWAKRLLQEGTYDVKVNSEAVLTAALFHDVGYSLSLDGSKHAENSAALFSKYAVAKGYDAEIKDFTEYLIRNHSNKILMNDNSVPLELIILMEADLLDETGALSIVWDCMMEGGQKIQSFEKTYKHIQSYSAKLLDENPMKTALAKAIWSNKQNLIKEFLRQLSYDLAICE